MATTKDFKVLEREGVRVFISGISRDKVRVSIIESENAKNAKDYRDGYLIFQQIYSCWYAVPKRDIERASKLING